MAWELTDDRPIYLQLMEHIQGDILSGIYPLGGKLPSVRDLAADASVNPNTMQKALSELERIGLLYSQRTSGRFVTEDKKLIQSLQSSIAEKEISEFLKKMERYGLTREDIINLIK
ncbi:GntR family transcriptional regulator [Anaerostipes sp.]|uniref:GntR family transcriptional regulator n=1 Tax=Anaerostipes sp. TaxID=1872530 RepID=UPI0025C1DF92|nr:GntR family transcriptional regulator [Anaerostipes sp.]MBS7007586.1 GntR family transcriptional regulator [Anaerostipes sp.]